MANKRKRFKVRGELASLHPIKGRSSRYNTPYCKKCLNTGKVYEDIVLPNIKDINNIKTEVKNCPNC